MGTPAAPPPAFARGAAWSAVNAFAGVALPFIGFIAFARILSPVQIGAVVLATSIAEIIKAFGAPGLYEALLQQGPDARRHHQTASYILLTAGIALTAVFVFLMIALGHYLPSISNAGWALDLVGIRIFFDLATVQPQAALAQRLSFGRMASRSIVANTGAGLAGGLVAVAGWPFLGLVIYLAGQSVLIFLTTAIGTAVLVRPRFWPDCAATMRKEAVAASIVRLVAAINNGLDQIVVASLIGSASLAFFNLGKRVETTFITAAASFSTILFQPLFAVTAPAARAAGLRNGLAMLTLICGAPAAFMVTNAPGLIHLVFGDRWAGAAPAAAILACSGFARALGSVHGALLSVSHRNRPLMGVTSVSAISGIVLAVVLAPAGIASVAAGLAIKNVAMVAWMAILTRRDIPRCGVAYLAVVFLPFAAMLAAGYGAHAVAGSLAGASPAVLAAVLGVSGCAIGLAGLAALAPSLQLPAQLLGLLPFRRRVDPNWSISP